MNDAWVTPTIAALWVIFLATHIGFSSQRLRPRLVQRLGATGFLGAYSALALAIFVPLVTVYAMHKHAGAYLWYGSATPWMRPPVYLAMAFAFTLMIGAFLNPSPASIAPGKGGACGVLRVTRHPLFMGVGLFGLLHLCVIRVHASELAFFAGMPVAALLGCWHQDLRKLAENDREFLDFYQKTSFLPFGRGGLRGLVDPPIAIAIGAGLIATLLLRVFHPTLFGGA